MRCLEKLIDLGYEVGLRNEKIYYKSKTSEPVSEAVLRPITEEIKLKRDKVIKFLKVTNNFQQSSTTKAVFTEYKILNDNRVKGTWIISEIIKELHSGENIYALFIKSMECIGKLIGDELTSEVVKKDLQSFRHCLFP